MLSTQDISDDGEDGSGYRKGSQFKSHLKKSEAASEFSRNKTLAEQRRSLPVFHVKDDLLQVIRENQVVVVVGETGFRKNYTGSNIVDTDEGHI